MPFEFGNYNDAVNMHADISHCKLMKPKFLLLNYRILV